MEWGFSLVVYQCASVCAHLRHISVQLCLHTWGIPVCVYLGVHSCGIPVCICVFRFWSLYTSRSLVFERYSRLFWDSLLENLGKSQKKWRRLEGITWRGKFLLKLQRVERMTDSLKRGICSKKHWYKPPPTREGCRCATVCARSETSGCGSSRQRGLSLSLLTLCHSCLFPSANRTSDF